MTYTSGWYFTRSRHDAVIAQVKVINNRWVIRGAVELDNGILHLTCWNMFGKHMIDSNYDLMERIYER